MTRSRLLDGPAPVLVLVVAAAAAAALRGGFTDLVVYLYGGRTLLDGLPLYEAREPLNDLRFTYPPFAAVVMVPLTLLPEWLAAGLWTGASVGALAAVVVVVRRSSTGPHRWLVALVTAVRSLSRWQNLTFGQVNLFLMLAVLVDLLRPERRWSGVAGRHRGGPEADPARVRRAAGARRTRAAAVRAALAFAGTVAVGFAAAPSSTAQYWSDDLVDAGRVGPPTLAHNQSVYGALTRLLDGPPSTLLWLAVAGPLGARGPRRAPVRPGGVAATGCSAPGAGRAAMAQLLLRRRRSLASVAPRDRVLALPSRLARSRGRTTGCGQSRSRWSCGSEPVASAAWTAVFVARPILWPPWGQGREYAWSPIDHVVGNAYLLAALTLSAWAAVTVDRGAALRGGRSRTPGSRWRRPPSA